MELKRSGESGAGDRDRTGDIQLGKLTFPLAGLTISFQIRHLSRKPFILNSMGRLTRVHILRRFAYTVPLFSRFWTVWTVRHFEECYEFFSGGRCLIFF